MRRDYLYVTVLVLLLLAWKSCHDRSQRALGAALETADRLSRERAAALAQADSLARVERVQVDTLRVAHIRRDTVLRTIEHYLTDTVPVPVPVEVVREVVRVDSVVIASCSSVLATCQHRATTLERALARSDSLVTLWRAQARPTVWQQVTDKLPWVLGAYAIGRLHLP